MSDNVLDDDSQSASEGTAIDLPITDSVGKALQQVLFRFGIDARPLKLATEKALRHRVESEIKTIGEKQNRTFAANFADIVINDFEKLYEIRSTQPEKWDGLARELPASAEAFIHYKESSAETFKAGKEDDLRKFVVTNCLHRATTPNERIQTLLDAKHITAEQLNDARDQVQTALQIERERQKKRENERRL